MAAPGDEIAAGAGGNDRLRASHADREQAIEVLKAAFVQERLDRDELDARVGQALASRTHAELAMLTMDIPVGLVADLQCRKPARRPAGKIAAGAGLVVPPGAMLAAAFLSGSEQLFKLCMLVVSWFIIAWVIAGTRALANWHDKRAGRRSTPGLSPGAGSETSGRPALADPARQLPRTGHGPEHTAEAAQIRRQLRRSPADLILRLWAAPAALIRLPA